MMVLVTRDIAANRTDLISVAGRGIRLLVALFRATASVGCDTACIATTVTGGFGQPGPRTAGLADSCS